MVQSMMLDRLKNADLLKPPNPNRIPLSLVAKAMDLIRLRNEKHRKPTASNRLEAKAQRESNHRGDYRCVVPVPVATHQERRWA